MLGIVLTPLMPLGVTTSTVASTAGTSTAHSSNGRSARSIAKARFGR
jgi:hypothetical protein